MKIDFHSVFLKHFRQLVRLHNANLHVGVLFHNLKGTGACSIGLASVLRDDDVEFTIIRIQPTG